MEKAKIGETTHGKDGGLIREEVRVKSVLWTDRGRVVKIYFS